MPPVVMEYFLPFICDYQDQTCLEQPVDIKIERKKGKQEIRRVWLNNLPTDFQDLLKCLDALPLPPCLLSDKSHVLFEPVCFGVYVCVCCLLFYANTPFNLGAACVFF